MGPPIEDLTTDGFDMQFGTNVVGMSQSFRSTSGTLDQLVTFKGHWLFTELLLPALQAGAKSSADGYSRVVTTSSSGAHLAGAIKWDTFKDCPARTKLGTQALYFQSKLVRRISQL